MAPLGPGLSLTTLTEDVQVDSFCCGRIEIDDWFHNQALRFHKAGSAVVHVCLDTDGNVLGFFTLTSHYLRKNNLPKSPNLSGSNIPVTLLGRLGVSTGNQGCGLGTWLVEQAKQLALAVSKVSAARFLYVQAKDDALVGWYRDKGFRSFPSDSKKMIYDLRSGL
ncbi:MULTISPECIES: GNAT family N-acetyltransferase [Bifidobacterium]|uniref:GNAT family N-acetyltransferase n=1 Tax=Bifidobacterium asteroides TaxID=1684 RepID=A0A556RA00_9BIFI|nr:MULTISPECIES: GNAT family N-acetyltransferase [Bifidobacterium]MBI0086590.1 GNAT family N-acetyltransferase [Bifidobacterium sp. M0404]TSJ85703.1 GNAT family N-acetyltransferase [Bifidobacterium polysaccharolyticum]